MNTAPNQNELTELFMIPFSVHEGEVTRAERTQKRLIAIIIILIILLAGTNIGWAIYEAQYEDIVTTQTVEQEADSGENLFVGGDYNGTAESNDHN